MSDDRFKRIAIGLVKAVQTPTDELAARKGEGDLLVQVKRNSDRLRDCAGHTFVPCPDWRQSVILSRVKVTCSHCGGEMNAGDAMTYLRGFAHGSGQDYVAIINRVFPPGDPA